MAKVKYTSFTDVLKSKLKELGFESMDEYVERGILEGHEFAKYGIEYRGLKYLLLFGIYQKYSFQKPWPKQDHKDNGKLVMDFWCINEPSTEHDEIYCIDNERVSLALEKLIADQPIEDVVSHFEKTYYIYEEQK